jgi:hypothetical protein
MVVDAYPLDKLERKMPSSSTAKKKKRNPEPSVFWFRIGSHKKNRKTRALRCSLLLYEAGHVPSLIKV